MSQWHKLSWTKDKLRAVGDPIIIRPHTDETGKKTAKAHNCQHRAYHELDFDKKHDSNKGMAHLHDGVVDHIKIHQEDRGERGISVHAVWHDKDGNVVRRDAHFEGH